MHELCKTKLLKNGYKDMNLLIWLFTDKESKKTI